MTFDEYYEWAESRPMYKPPPRPTVEQAFTPTAADFHRRAMQRNEDITYNLKKDLREANKEIERLREVIKSLQDEQEGFSPIPPHPDPPQQVGREGSLVAEAVTDVTPEGESVL
jgi:hypothetical protein